MPAQIEKTRLFEQLRATRRGDLETFTVLEFFVHGHGPFTVSMPSSSFTADALNALADAKAAEIASTGIKPFGS